jgi:predicted PurR-regulated permease PerM
MSTESLPADDKRFLIRTLEAAIRIGLVILLIAWCYEIVRPFLVPIVRGVIIAIAAYPGYLRLKSWLGGRGRLAAVLTTVILLILVLTPTIMLFIGAVMLALGWELFLAWLNMEPQTPAEALAGRP